MNLLRCTLFVCTFTTVGSGLAANQERRLGDWHGLLATPMGKLTLLVHLRESADADLAGDLESVDQAPGQKIPIAQIIMTSTRLAFSVPQIGATFEGDWNDAKQEWIGVFRQGTTFPLSLQRGAPPAATVISGLDGVWRATLQRNSANLRLILHVRTTQIGTRVTLDSPDLAAYGLPVERFEKAGNTVRFHVPSASVEFEGTLDEAMRSLSGRWSRQGWPDAQIAFQRDIAEATQRKRSQWPIQPAGYRTEEVKIANPIAPGVTLAGTLTLPEGKGPFPAAVLISGSGPQDRDETIFGHKPFAVLADALVRRGIAVLRFDDRGFGGSTGDHEKATSADFADDANAVVNYLLGKGEIDPRAVGLVGHSEGGLIGPIAAASNDRLAFLVLLAGPGTNTVQLELSQRRLMGLSQGIAEEQLERTEPIIRKLLEEVRSSKDSQDAAKRIHTVLTKETLEALGASEAQRGEVIRQYTSAWMLYFLKYEPSTFLERIHVPVLALNGTLDQQVPCAENLAAIRAALAGKADVTVQELPGLNHLFQSAGTGALGEYADIEETFSPKAMDLIASWILARFGAPSPR